MKLDWLILSAVAAIAMLAACSDDPAIGASQSTDTAAPAPAATGASAAEIKAMTKGMISGVTTARPGAAIDLKFELKARPEVGQPLGIDIAMLPQAESPSLRATFLATEGLTIIQSPVPADYKKVQPGSVYRHELQIVPRENGVFYLSAIVIMGDEPDSQSRTFSIPVVVGPPLETDAVAGKEAAPADAAGATGQAPQATPH